MNGYERIMNAIEGRAVDRAPVWPFVMAFAAKYAGVPYSKFATDHRELVKAVIKAADDCQLDAVVMDSDAYREASACGVELEYPENDLPKVVKYAIEDKESFAFKLPDIGSSPRLIDKIDGIRKLKEHYGNEKVVSGWIESPLQSAAMLYNLNDFMIDLFEEPEFIEELLDFTAELGIQFALEQVKAGADIIGIGDATASMVSPSLYEELVFPFTQKVVDGIRERSDVKLKYHICGNAEHVLPFVKRIGFDLVNIDYKVSVEKAYEVLGDSICIKGNIDPVSMLKDGSVEDIKQEVNRLLDLKIPRYIISAGCEVARDTPVENLKALAEASKEYALR